MRGATSQASAARSRVWGVQAQKFIRISLLNKAKLSRLASSGGGLVWIASLSLAAMTVGAVSIQDNLPCRLATARRLRGLRQAQPRRGHSCGLS